MALFAIDDPATADLLREDRLVGVAQSLLPGLEFSDFYLLSQLQVAEREIESLLKTYLEPVEVLPASASQAERDALDAAGTRWVEEPGYDWTPETWRQDAWCYTVLRHRPVIAIHSIRFLYPRPAQTIFDVPLDWLRLDRKRGHFRLFPTGSGIMAPFAGFWGPWMLGGQVAPQMIAVRYRAGLIDAARDYPQLLDIIQKQAVLNLLQDQFLPQSGSQSIDGMSQSQSLDLDKHRDSLMTRVDTLRDTLHGIRMTFL